MEKVSFDRIGFSSAVVTILNASEPSARTIIVVNASSETIEDARRYLEELTLERAKEQFQIGVCMCCLIRTEASLRELKKSASLVEPNDYVIAALEDPASVLYAGIILPSRFVRIQHLLWQRREHTSDSYVADALDPDEPIVIAYASRKLVKPDELEMQLRECTPTLSYSA